MPQVMTIKVPKVAMGAEDGVVVDWYVNEGDRVSEGNDLVEVEFDKASQIIPCPVSGVVEEIYVAPGTEITVGERLCRIVSA